MATIIKNPNQPGKNKLPKPRPKKRKRFILLLVIMLIFGWVAWTRTKDVIISRMVPTVVVLEGALQRQVPVEVLIIREEKVVAAPAAGIWSPVAREGERVKAGGVLANIGPVPGVTSSVSGPVPVIAPVAGTVRYTIDGIEEVLAPRAILTYDWNSIRELGASYNPTVYKPGEAVMPGQAVAKIINNLSPPFFFATAQEGSLAVAPKEGSHVKLEWNDGTSADASVVRWRRRGAEIDFLLRALSGDKIPLERMTSGKMVIEQWLGVIVPEKAIVTEQGKNGVLLVRSHGIVWHPVEIKGKGRRTGSSDWIGGRIKNSC
ncbi:MAG: HlyD family efflux transporter periplasmic adaptor subunit [Bacillota bacterium]